MATAETRLAKAEEVLVRFIFQSGHIRSSVKKQALKVAPHPKTGRLELSMYLKEDILDESGTERWEDFSRLGNRRPEEKAKGYGEINADAVRNDETLESLDAEVNNTPYDGHSDIIGWNTDEEVRTEQIVRFAKILRPVKRPPSI